MPVLFVSQPVAFIDASILLHVFAEPFCSILSPLTVVHVAICMLEHPLPVRHIALPVAFVTLSVWPDVHTVSFAHFCSFDHLPIVETLVVSKEIVNNREFRASVSARSRAGYFELWFAIVESFQSRYPLSRGVSAKSRLNSNY